MTESKKNHIKTVPATKLPSEKERNNHNALKKIAIFLISLLAIVLLFNALMLIIGIKTTHFQRWASEQCFGEIVEMYDDSIVIQGRGNDQKTIVLTEKTVLRKGTKKAQATLQIGDRVMILGSQSHDGQIEAQLIRIFDPNDQKN